MRIKDQRENGATAVEYALMVGLVAVGIVAAVSGLRDKISSTFTKASTAMVVPKLLPFSSPVSGTYTIVGVGSTISGWSITKGNVDLLAINYQPAASANGQPYVDLNGATAGAITQTVPTISGTQYRLSYYLSGNTSCGLPSVVLYLSAGSATQNVNMPLAGLNWSTSLGWQSKTFDFTATGSNTLLSFESFESSFCGPMVSDIVLQEL